MIFSAAGGCEHQCCLENHYVSGRECVPCPAGSSSTGGTNFFLIFFSPFFFDFFFVNPGKIYLDSCVCNAGYYRLRDGDSFTCELCATECSDLGKRKSECFGDSWADTECICMEPPNVDISKMNTTTCAFRSNGIFFSEKSILVFFTYFFFSVCSLGFSSGSSSEVSVYNVRGSSEESRVYSWDVTNKFAKVLNFEGDFSVFFSRENAIFFFLSFSDGKVFRTTSSNVIVDNTDAIIDASGETNAETVLGLQILYDDKQEFDRIYFSLSFGSGSRVYETRLWPTSGNYNDVNDAKYEFSKHKASLFVIGGNSITFWDTLSKSVFFFFLFCMFVCDLFFFFRGIYQDSGSGLKVLVNNVENFNFFMNVSSTDIFFAHGGMFYKYSLMNSVDWVLQADLFYAVEEAGHNGVIHSGVLFSENVLFYTTKEDGNMWMFDMLQGYVRRWEPQERKNMFVNFILKRQDESSVFIARTENDITSVDEIKVRKCGPGRVAQSVCENCNNDGSICVTLPCYREFLCPDLRDGEDCKCVDGYYENDKKECTVCPSTSFCSDGKREACPNHMTSLHFSSSESDCFCDNGYIYDYDSGECVLCGSDEYCTASLLDFQSGVQRETCPNAGQVSPVSGKGWIGDCLCDPKRGFFLDSGGEKCISCEQASCKVLSTGSSGKVRFVVSLVVAKESLANKMESDLATRNLGFTSVDCTRKFSKNGLHEYVCIFDFSDLNSERYFAQDKQVRDGVSLFSIAQISEQEMSDTPTLGTFAPNSYQRCPAGKVFSDAGVCVCRAGYFASSDGSCFSCASGEYKPDAGDAECISCPYQSTSSAGANDCVCNAKKNLFFDALEGCCKSQQTKACVKEAPGVLGLSVFEFLLVSLAIFIFMICSVYQYVKQKKRR